VIAESISHDLVAWDHLNGPTSPNFVDKITVAYIKLNHMHLFPEGSGRPTQVFIEQLAGSLKARATRSTAGRRLFSPSVSYRTGHGTTSS
jgi:fido (protein-threonine AMPylation protein)